MRTKVVLDTSVIIEYVDKAGPWHKHARAIFNEIIRGRVVAFIPAIVLSEVLYVARRVYEKTKARDPKGKAIRLVKWLYQHPNIRIIGRSLRVIILAGLIKSKYRLAISDCYVLALAKIMHAKPVFRKKEKEMMKHLKVLRKRYNVIFLDDY